MADETTELEKACFDLARAIKWSGKPVGVEELQGLASRLAAVAIDARSEELGRTLPVITRAVRYLTQAHAIPPMGDNTRWFSNMLEAVLEVAYPNAGLSGEARMFLNDMAEGIQASMDEE